MGILSLNAGPSSSTVLSLVLQADHCDWVLAKVKKRARLSCQSVVAAGALPSNPMLFNDAGQITPVGFRAVLDATIGQVAGKAKVPKDIVVTLPSIHAFQFELIASRGEDEVQIQFRIEDMLAELNAGQGDTAIYDWQYKSEADPNTGERQVVVAAMRQDQLETIRSVCSGSGLKCVGLALDSQACANGYFKAFRESKSEKWSSLNEKRYLLLGHLSPKLVKLSVFNDGLLISENIANQEHEFSLIQSLSALEKLVTGWSRGGGAQSDGEVALILAGPFAGAKGAYSTASRSNSIGPLLLEVRPVHSLSETWHESVTAFGALEGLPCE